MPHSVKLKTFPRSARSCLPAPPKPETSSGSIPKLCLIGHGYRTNAAGIHQMRALLAPKGVEVFSAPLPYGPGPSACLHLMSLISLLDDHTALVDLPWLAVETVELLKSRGFNIHRNRSLRARHPRLQRPRLGEQPPARHRRKSQHQRPPPPSRIRRPHLPRQRTLHQRQRRPHLPNPPPASDLSG